LSFIAAILLDGDLAGAGDATDHFFFSNYSGCVYTGFLVIL